MNISEIVDKEEPDKEDQRRWLIHEAEMNRLSGREEYKKMEEKRFF